jgi:hypothetical protein
VAGRLTPEPVAEAAQAGRVFEMRTYTTNEGKLPNREYDAVHLALEGT